MQTNKTRDIAEETKLEDLADKNVPSCLYWTCEEVCDFFEKKLKLPEYKDTLHSNQIDGKRLVYLDSSHLPKIGINDFKHMMLITKSVREILKIKEPYWNRSISVIPRDTLDLYLEAKSISGKKTDSLTFERFKEDTKDSKWQPPLTNHGFIQPSY